MCDHSSPRAGRVAAYHPPLPLPPLPPSPPRPTYLLRGSCTATLSCHCVGDATSEASNLILQLRRERERERKGGGREGENVRALRQKKKKQRPARVIVIHAGDPDTDVARVACQRRRRRRRRRRRSPPRRSETVACASSFTGNSPRRSSLKSRGS